MVLRVAFHEEFSHLPGGLGHFADSNSIPQNQSARTILHASPIAPVQQSFLLKPFVWIFPQYHSSRIEQVMKFDESMINLHKIYHGLKKNVSVNDLRLF